MTARRTSFWRPWRQAAVAACLLAYLAATVGFPLPAKPRTGQAVRPCGCPAGACRHCCCSSPARPARSCCGAGGCCAAKPSRAEPAETGVRWVAGLSAWRCQGLNVLWVTPGAALVPPPLTWAPDCPVLGWLRETAAASALPRRPISP
jgi:hypothetical protein